MNEIVENICGFLFIAVTETAVTTINLDYSKGENNISFSAINVKGSHDSKLTTWLLFYYKYYIFKIQTEI